MNLEELKAKLEAGEITQEEYDAKVAELKKKSGDSKDGDPAGGSGGGLTREEVEKMIQSATDRVRTEYSKKLKAAEEELEKLRKEKMSAEERAEYERKEKERQLQEKEQELIRREVALHTVDKLRELELPLEFRDILAGANIEETDQRIANFQKMWQAALKKAVEERFKAAGHEPGKGKDGEAPVKNPWAKETFNLTEQARILRENPELAKKLKAAAGVN